jgi:hypothetical protein
MNLCLNLKICVIANDVSTFNTTKSQYTAVQARKDVTTYYSFHTCINSLVYNNFDSVSISSALYIVYIHLYLNYFLCTSNDTLQMYNILY